MLAIFSYFLSDFTGDEIWNYGFSYNIASGLVIYKDFNMVIGPLYNMIIALFLKPFGNNLIAFHLINSFIISIVITLIYKKLSWKYLYLLLLIALLPNMYSYNTFVALLTIIILILEDSFLKYKNIFIGITIGSILITKQNVGLGLLLAGLFCSNEKLKTLMGTLIPVGILFTILIYYNALHEYIDFCFLGLGGFLDNLLIESTALILLAIIFFFLIHEYIHKNKKMLLYLIAFLIITFPILDNTHVLIGAIPVLYYVLLKITNRNILLLIKTVLIVSVCLSPLKNIPFHFMNNDTFLKYRHVKGDNTNNYLVGMTTYIKEKEKKNTVYLFIENAYLIRLSLKQNPIFYDLINKGNLGSKPEKYLEAINNNCKDKSCLFILDRKYFAKEKNNQLDFSFKTFVIDNYQYLETLPSGDKVYKN